MIIIIALSVALIGLAVVFFLHSKRYKTEIDILIQSNAAKDATLADNDERLKSAMKKMADIDKINNQLTDVINMLLTVSPRYVLKAFADQKLAELVQKETIVEKKKVFNFSEKIIADRAVDKPALTSSL